MVSPRHRPVKRSSARLRAASLVYRVSMVRVATARGTFSLMSGRTRNCTAPINARKNYRRRFFARPQNQSRPKLGAFVRGTPFQLHVWRALLRVPAGSLTSYGQLSAAIVPRARRARSVAPWVQSDRLHHPVSPCYSRDQCPRGLSPGPDPQTRHDRLGNFRALAVARGRTVPDSGQRRLTKRKIDNLDLANIVRLDVRDTA